MQKYLPNMVENGSLFVHIYQQERTQTLVGIAENKNYYK